MELQEHRLKTRRTVKGINNMNRVLLVADIEEITGLSRSTIYRQIASGDFPSPMRLSPGRRGWNQDDVEQWMAERALAERSRREQKDDGR